MFEKNRSQDALDSHVLPFARCYPPEWRTISPNVATIAQPVFLSPENYEFYLRLLGCHAARSHWIAEAFTIAKRYADGVGKMVIVAGKTDHGLH